MGANDAAEQLIVAIGADEVRRRYTTGAPGSALSRSSSARREAGHEFDRWLESVKREAAAVALEEAWKLRRGADRWGVESVPADWLLELATTTRNPRTPGEETTNG